MSSNYAYELRERWNAILLNKSIEVCSEKLSGCGMLDLKILKLIYQNQGIRIKEIIKRLDVPNSTFTNVVNRLVNKQLLVRKLSSSDLRSYELLLSETGRGAVEEHLEAETQVFEGLIADFNSSEKETLIALMDRMIENANKLK